MVLAVEHKRENAKFAEKNGQMGLPKGGDGANAQGKRGVQSPQTDQAGFPEFQKAYPAVAQLALREKGCKMKFSSRLRTAPKGVAFRERARRVRSLSLGKALRDERAIAARFAPQPIDAAGAT